MLTREEMERHLKSLNEELKNLHNGDYQRAHELRVEILQYERWLGVATVPDGWEAW